MSAPEPAHRRRRGGPSTASAAARGGSTGLTGTFMIVCILTAAVLYNGSIAVLVGHRYLVEQIHVYSGFALPVPMLARPRQPGLPRRRSPAQPLHPVATGLAAVAHPPRRHHRVGKFNAGQKLNAALSAGSIARAAGHRACVMYFTGPGPAALAHRRDVRARLVRPRRRLLVLGHISMALKDPHAMTGMRTGRVPLRWARGEHAAWADDMVPAPDQSPVIQPSQRGGPVGCWPPRTRGWCEMTRTTRAIPPGGHRRRRHPSSRARPGPRAGPARPHRGGARRPDHRALRSRRRLRLHLVAAGTTSGHGRRTDRAARRDGERQRVPPVRRRPRQVPRRARRATPRTSSPLLASAGWTPCSPTAFRGS